METMDGVVTIVQDSRFQLVDEQGVAHLFLLTHRSLAEPAQLGPLQARQAKVRVKFTQVPNLIANVAHSITLLALADDRSRSR